MDLSLVTTIIQNALFLLGLAFVYELTLMPRFKNKASTPYLSGLFICLIALAVLSKTFILQEGVVLDTRSILLSLTSLFFPPITTAITGAFAFFLRWQMGGIALPTGLTVVMISSLSGLVWKRFLFKHALRHSSLSLYLFSVTVHGLMLLAFFLLPSEMAWDILGKIAWPVMLAYPFASLLLSRLLVLQLERAQAIDQQDQMKARFQGLLASLEEGVCLQLNQRLIQANYKAIDLLGLLPNQDSHPSAFTDYLHPEDRTKVNRLIERLKVGKDSSCVTTEVRLQHSTHSLDLSLRICLTPHEGQEALMFVFQDIRLQQQLQDENERLKLTLADRRQQSLQADLSLNLVRLLEPSFNTLRDFGPGDLDHIVKRDQFFQSRERVREGLGTFLNLIRCEDKPGPIHLNRIVEDLLPLIKTFLNQDRVSLVLDLDKGLPEAFSCALNLQLCLMHLLFWSLGTIKTIQQATTFKAPLFLNTHHHQEPGVGFLRLSLDYPGTAQATPTEPVEDENLARVRKVLKSCRGELVARQGDSGAFSLQLDLPLI